MQQIWPEIHLSRDTNGISELALIQLILPYIISCIRGSSEIPLLSLHLSPSQLSGINLVNNQKPGERLDKGVSVIVISAIMTRCRDADVWGDADVTFTMRHNLRYSVIFRERDRREIRDSKWISKLALIQLIL